MKIKFPQTSPTISPIYLLDFSLNTRYLFVYSQDLLLNIRYDLALESWKGGKSLVYLPLPDCTYSAFRYLFNARVIFTPLITSVCFLKRHRQFLNLWCLSVFIFHQSCILSLLAWEKKYSFHPYFLKKYTYIIHIIM